MQAFQVAFELNLYKRERFHSWRAGEPNSGCFAFLAVPEWGPKQTKAGFPIGEVLSYPEYVAFLRLFRIALALLFMNPTRVWIHLVKGLKWLETGDENIVGVVVPWGLQLLLFEGLS